MRRPAGFSIVVAALLVAAPVVLAAEHPIPGKRLLVRDPHGDETHRSLALVARGEADDGGAIAGNPAVDGADLLIGLSSGAAGQAFHLDAAGWTPTAHGFRYDAPAAATAPVQRVLLRRSDRGGLRLEVVLRGRVGSVPLELVPPVPASDASLVLSLTGGDSYCVAFGGAAGGRTVASTTRSWRIVEASSAPPCPALCCSFGLACAWGAGADAAACSALGGALGVPGTVCDGGTGACAPAPASVGNCCALGPLCFGGPGVQQPPCDEVGDGFFTAAVCDPVLGCVVP
jgi:hypothetical protein